MSSKKKVSKSVKSVFFNIFNIFKTMEVTDSDERFIVTDKKAAMKESTDVISIALHHGINAQSSLYKIKRGSTLRLIPAPSLLGREIILYTNYPEYDKAEFIRTEYRELMWQSRYGEDLTHILHKHVHVTDIDIYCEIQMNRTGTYYFYYEHSEDSVAIDKDQIGSLYVQVEPILHVGPPKAQKIIPLDAIRCQTFLAKCLGPLNTWENKLRVAKESGYNLIHFTPIQELGQSRSCYSLKNQLKVNPDFAVKEIATFTEVETIIKKCRQEWGIASICDIVLNHMANESDWLIEHPEVTYSCDTCPHLRPAFLLDACLARCGTDILASALELVGVPPIIETENHLEALKYQLHTHYLPKVAIHELYQCDVQAYITQFLEEMRKRPPPKHVIIKDKISELKLKQDPEYRRLNSKIDMSLALDIFNVFRADSFDEETRLKKCAEDFRQKLEELNENIRKEIQEHLNCAVENCIAGIRYERVQHDGPNIRVISKKYPVFTKYFTHIGLNGKNLKQIEEVMYKEEGKYFMAHNGWVMGCSDPLKDFARPQPGTANVYLRRELIAWGDSVKLRYGDKPEDCPFLWDHMKQYVEITAKIFDGVRLDNCHSTPLHVAEYLLDCARRVNPNLYVAAELFTNSDSADNIFVNRLGITSLIREAQSAWNSHEEGRLVYRYGGAPVGAFFVSPKRPLASGIAHAMFLDLTHDNPSPIEKRSVYDLLPTAALVSMACCATGSNRGYDELVPHHIHVVDEERQYQEWDKGVNNQTGIIPAKRALNLLHGELAEEGFNQVFVDQMDPNIVAVTRHSPTTHQSVILVAHTCFGYPDPQAGPTGVRPLRFEGNLDEIIFEAKFHHKSGKPYDKPFQYKKNEKYINGLTEYTLEIQEHIPLSQSKIFNKTPVIDGNITQLNLDNLRPGSIVAVRVSLHPATKPHFSKLHDLRDSLRSRTGKSYKDLEAIVAKLNLVDLNRVLFTCDAEERDLGFGGGAYDIPGYGPIVYCGLQGIVSLLTEIAPNNDLGHPLCGNLRLGDWMIDYVHKRLAHDKRTLELSKWLETHLEAVKYIPRYLVPAYFDVILTEVYDILVNHAFELMSDFIKKGTTFPQSLGLASLQFLAVCKSADLPKLSPNIHPPPAPEHFVTVSAGLPHFSTGYMRCWGRDTFIALRGILLLTGRYNEARHIILGFGGCLRHGLIPNLLDNGTKPRFNCRDAVWWWMHSIKQYVKEVPNGKSILNDTVSRIFPTDNSEARPPGENDQLLYDTMQEALTVHFQGLVFRERNAGSQIDAHMTDKGFNLQIGVDPVTGFVFGGNDANCGTWMDKMGSSDKAGNRGKPTTPRDGSAVELVGLQMAVLRFMQELSEQAVIPYKYVERTGKDGEKTVWTYQQWADKILVNFEKNFFTGSLGGPYLNKKNIFKDTVGATQQWADYQLRCNFPIAMVVAPELFHPQHAWEALNMAQKYLVGPLGMKTLDPEDWAYRANYDNSNDSDDITVAHGANYHQGPEWLWPMGYYLRARLVFGKEKHLIRQTVADVWNVLTAHLKELQTSHWRGLPELTNDNGSYCEHSCRTQAWSIATILEVLRDLEELEYVV